ncbi:hypothetical protein PRECH8_25130 [Insulibacter thermoxylanivorax]|uniref:Uncharacterized protein n=1 Tax=Insulibacter thermoxylanivorax TaxID=2749268 RepID=A0A916VGB3_9BACL|nr:hypothetical protein [Insulibacter thermoxylanivorax]GFR39217.1 hypothetical protein PRECH8_25130 [Insulibacter thermoxylanivorax]
MRISSVSDITANQVSFGIATDHYDRRDLRTGHRADQVELSPIFQAYAVPAANSQNQVNIKPSEVYSFGSINGKPLRFRLHSNGLIETNISPMIQASAPGTSVTPYQYAAAMHHRSYTEEEHREANRLISRLMDLLDLSANKMTMEEYRSRESSPYSVSTAKLLEHLGINPAEVFTINGVRYRFNNGILTRLS